MYAEHFAEIPVRCENRAIWKWHRVAAASAAFAVSSFARGAAQEPDTSVFAQVRAAALTASPDIRAARAVVDAAQGRLAAAGFGPPAMLSAEVEEVPGGFGFDGPLPLRLMIDKAFQSPGQQSAARAVADVELSAARARLVAAQRTVNAQAGLALARTVGWSTVAGRLVEEDSVLASTEASLRTRFASAGARYVDVIRLHTERLSVEVSLAEARSESRAGRLQLEALLPPEDPAARAALDLLDGLLARAVAQAGRGSAAPGNDLTDLLPPPPDVDSFVLEAGAVRLAETDVELARSQRQLVAALQRPQLSAYVGAERTRGEAGGAVYGPVAGLSVSLPFTAREANRTALEAARLEVSAAEAGLESARTTMRAELSAARERYEAALARADVYDADLLRAARMERESALAAYRTGQLTLTELLDFERSLAAAQRSRVESQIAAAQALADLMGTAFNVTAP